MSRSVLASAATVPSSRRRPGIGAASRWRKRGRATAASTARRRSGEGQQLFVNAQYIKDLSFENPRAPQSLIQPAAQPEVAINVDVQGRNLGPEVFEVTLKINVTARAQDEPVFLVELAYAAVVTIKNATDATLPALVLVETPRIIFPFARAVVANATRDGGFPATDDQSDRFRRIVAASADADDNADVAGRPDHLSLTLRPARAAPSAIAASPRARRSRPPMAHAAAADARCGRR